MQLRTSLSCLVVTGLLGTLGCSGDTSNPGNTTGGRSNGGSSSANGGSGTSNGGSTSPSNGGSSSSSGGSSSASGGGSSGGSSSTSGGSAAGGNSSSGGSSAGGSASTAGGSNSGGATAGGTAAGGSTAGGSTSGGSTSGGTSAGGSTTAAGGTAAGGSAMGGTTSASGGSTSVGGSPLCAGTVLAFPGAQGFGKNATGARAGSVYHVTNLNDTGAGSFRDAVSASNRFVVFDVSGYITLKTAVSAKSNLTIAGQTAPGGGIGFRGGEISFANQSNVIMRHVRIRPGSETVSTEDDALSLYRAKNVILDHSSFEFAPWNNVDGVSDDWQNYPVTDITFQDSLIADPTGQQFGVHAESVSSNWAFYRNIFANSHNRNPLSKVNDVFVNNLLYNYSAGYTTHTSTNFKHDIVNNYFVMGPASSGTDNTWFQVDKNQSIYYAGNLKDTNLNGTLDGAATTPYWYQGEGTVLTSAWSTETNATPPLSAASGARVAISQAGTLPRDPMDALIISQVATLGKGTTGLGAGTVGPGGALYTSQTQTGLDNNGYGTIATGTRPTDTDNDGMSDAWEKAMGSNPAVADAMTKGCIGYALIEDYVNFLAVPHATSTAAAAVDVNLSAYSGGFSAVSPTFSVASAQNGAVTLASDGHTAHFQPTAGFRGLGAFSFTVKGSDSTAFTQQVLVLVTP
ncbi:MAG: hypothetical protein QM756_33635 [Polyangiaceae bacterium]